MSNAMAATTTSESGLLQLRREGVDLAELSDEALVAGCATGDRGARAALFERHAVAVHRFVGRLAAADADVVDDLVQTTFLEAFKGAARFRAGSAVRTWLCGIAHNLVRTYARGEIRRKTAMRSLAGTVAVGPTGSHGVDPARRQLATRVAAAVEELGDELREVFIMVDAEGLRGTEAAQILGVPEGTVWRRLFEARKRIRAALERGAS